MVEGRAPRAVLRYARRGRAEEEASVAEEAAVRVLHNGEAVATLAASPVDLERLAVGHLALQGRVRGPGDVRRVNVSRARGSLHVLVEGRAWPPAVPAPRLPAGPRVAPAQVHAWMRALLDGAALYREGGGVHTSALAGPEGLALLAADVGKVNTLDRLAGDALQRGVATRGFALLTTGRLTGAMVAKALAMGCPLLVSHRGPTTAGLDLAARRRATLVGYARGGSLLVYCGPARLRAPRRTLPP